MKPNGTSGNGAGIGGGRVTRLQPTDRAELVDPQLERQLLYSCMVYPELVTSCGVQEADFSLTAHRIVFSALLGQVARGEQTDTAAIRTRLTDDNLLAVVGGDDFLLSLGDTMPVRTGSWKRIRKLAVRRRIAELGALVHAKAGDPEELTRYIEQTAAAYGELLELDAPDKPPRTVADSILAIESIGMRLPTGLPTLDEATRGGIATGKVVFVLGAPGSSKTNFVTWLGDSWERAGCAVLFVAADESRDMILTRWGQLDGFHRERLESDDTGGRNAFARRSRDRHFDVVDPFDDAVSLERAEGLLLKLAGGRPRVLIVDSLQTAPCDAHRDCETRREEIEASVAVLKAISKRGTIVVAISEMNRSGYANQKAAQNTSALAAGAESRSIEYAAQLVLGLRPVADQTGVTDVEVAKNRLGSGKPAVRMSLDFGTLAFREIDKPDTEVEQVESEQRRNTALRARILDAIRRDSLGQLRTVRQVLTAAKVKRNTGVVVMRELAEERAVSKVDGSYRVISGGNS